MLVRKQFLPKVAETLVETCFCQDGAGGNLPTLIFRHRHRHHGGMPNKTPPPTELQIPATITTLLSSILLFACLHQQPITEPNVVFVGQQKSLMCQFGQHKLLNKKMDNFSCHMDKFCLATLSANKVVLFLLVI